MSLEDRIFKAVLAEVRDYKKQYDAQIDEDLLAHWIAQTVAREVIYTSSDEASC